MTRDELLRMLATAVAAGLITEADAVLLRERFDAGTISQADLPAEPERGITRTQVAAAAFLLAAVLGRGPARAAGIKREVPQRLRDGRLCHAMRPRSAHGMSTMIGLLRRQLIAHYVLGSGGMPANLEPLTTAYQTQLAYLHRFAVQRAVAVAKDKPMSEAAVHSSLEPLRRRGP